MKKDLLKILACPYCKSELVYKKDLICTKCKKIYKVEGDIPYFT